MDRRLKIGLTAGVIGIGGLVLWRTMSSASPTGPGGSGGPVVYFHGYGAPADDLTGLAFDVESLGGPGVSQSAFVAGPIDLFGGHRAWWQSRPEAEASRGYASKLIEKHLAADLRPMLVGFSQGAAVAVELGLRTPGVSCIAAIAPVAHPAQPTWPEAVDGTRIRVFIAHGSRDRIAPESVSTELRRILLAQGVDVTYVDHGGGHEIPSSVRTSLAQFLTGCR